MIKCLCTGESVEIERITKHDKKTHIDLKKITLN